MKGRIAALVMAALLLLYIVLVAQRAVLLLTSGVPIGVTMGVVLIVLPIVAAWALWRELMFGFRTERLVHILEADGDLPVDDLPRGPGGRPSRDAADAEFPHYQAETEAHPDDWRSWFRLGLAYDASGDRRRARGAIRQAITVHRTDARSAHR